MSEERKENIQTGNPLGEASVASLMVKFAVPSIIAMLVSALYNIVDQLFIGQAVGTLGNAYHILYCTCTDVWYWRCFLL